MQAGSVARSFDYQPSGLEFSDNFPPEVGSFATVGAVETELVSSGQRFSSNHQEFPVTPSLSQEEYERQLEDGLEYVDSVYSDSDDDEEPDEERKRRAAEMRERMLMEPEIKFTQEEELQLDKLVKVRIFFTITHIFNFTSSSQSFCRTFIRSSFDRMFKSP